MVVLRNQGLPYNNYIFAFCRPFPLSLSLTLIHPILNISLSKAVNCTNYRAFSSLILSMAMMASASSGNPYENYDTAEIEQDSINANEGKIRLPFYCCIC